MGYANNKTSIPISLDDLHALLGDASYDTKTLCISPKIKMWAKWKPEGSVKVTPLTLLERQYNNFGLRVSTVYMGTAIITAIRNKTFVGGWYYAKPGSNDTGRLDDFFSPDFTQGYDHNALPPFPVLAGGTEIVGGAGTSTFITAMPPFIAADGSSLDLREFKNTSQDLNFSNWYFGILLVNASRVIAASSTTTVANETAWRVNFGGIPTSFAGDYTAVPIFSQQKLNPTSEYSTTVASGNRFVGLGNSGVSITLATESNAHVIRVSCEYNLPKTRISYKVSITNTTSTAHTYPTPKLQISTSGSGAGANLIDLVTFASQTVAAKEKWEISGSVAVPSGANTTDHVYCRITCPGDRTGDWVHFAETFKPVEELQPAT